jgi:hypothetical protein
MTGATITAADVTPTTPLTLAVAARLAFPDGSMSSDALRRLIVAGKLDAELIAGKYFVTLAAIGEMRKRCLVKAKDPASSSTIEATGSSQMADTTMGLDAMNMTANKLKNDLRNTSSKSTTRPKPSAKVTPIKPR